MWSTRKLGSSTKTIFNRFPGHMHIKCTWSQLIQLLYHLSQLSQLKLSQLGCPYWETFFWDMRGEKKLLFSSFFFFILSRRQRPAGLLLSLKTKAKLRVHQQRSLKLEPPLVRNTPTTRLHNKCQNLSVCHTCIHHWIVGRGVVCMHSWL